jgi:hypothetical protein
MTYLCNRAGFFAACITDQEAARLFAEASRDAAAMLCGEFGQRFTFWTLSRINAGLRLVPILVETLSDD